VTLALRRHRVRAASMLAGFAAIVATLAYVPFHQARTAYIIAEALTVETIPELVFETRILVGDGRSQQERGARLVLSRRTLTVMAKGELRRALHSVPYDSVISISYSRGPDPMWNSPQGPAPVNHPAEAALGLLGGAVQQHWIAVRTSTRARFVVLRFEDLLIGRVLAALEERTGRAPQVVRKRTRT